MSYIQDSDYEKAKQNGISRKLLYQRVYRDGLTIQDAITKPIQINKKSDWSKYKHIAQQNGIGYETFQSRIKQRKLTPQQASTEPILSPSERRKAQAKFKLTPDQDARRIEMGLSKSIVYARLRRNIPMDLALSYPPLTKSESAKLSRTQKKRFNQLYINSQKLKENKK